MTKGVDYAWGRPAPSALAHAGCGFAARYACTSDKTKAFSPAEVHSLLAGGLAVVVVFEDTGTMLRAGLGHDELTGDPSGMRHYPPVWSAVDGSAPHRSLRGHGGGVADAEAANRQVEAAGMAGIPIYFACDFDATPADQPLVNSYLAGAASVIGKARVGIYGGYWPVSRARAAGLVTWTWGTPAWSGTNWASCGWKPHIMQGGLATIAGTSCDWDESNAHDFGQWPRPSTGWTFPQPEGLRIGNQTRKGYTLAWHPVVGPDGQKPTSYSLATYLDGHVVSQQDHLTAAQASEYGPNGQGLPHGTYESHVWANGAPAAPDHATITVTLRA